MLSKQDLELFKDKPTQSLDDLKRLAEQRLIRLSKGARPWRMTYGTALSNPYHAANKKRRALVQKYCPDAWEGAYQTSGGRWVKSGLLWSEDWCRLVLASIEAARPITIDEAAATVAQLADEDEEPDNIIPIRRGAAS